MSERDEVDHPCTLRRLGVVVPARNEAGSLRACLHGLDRAARHVGLPLDVVVVLDACEDDSDRVCAAAAATLSCRVHRLEIDARSVGAARREGLDVLLGILRPADDWVATTDADSVVPRDWFARQLRHRDAGATMAVGTVRLAASEDRSELRARWRRAYRAAGHRHVHGANLSFEPTAYRRSGGFSVVTYDEDVHLIRAFARNGEHIVWATDMPVTTSARTVGRAPRGFADHLRRLDQRADATVPRVEAC